MSHLSAYDNDNDMNPRTGHNLSWTPEEPIVIQHAVSSPSSSLHIHNSSTTTDLEGMDEPALTVQTDMIYDTIDDDRHSHESKQYPFSPIVQFCIIKLQYCVTNMIQMIESVMCLVRQPTLR